MRENPNIRWMLGWSRSCWQSLGRNSVEAVVLLYIQRGSRPPPAVPYGPFLPTFLRERPARARRGCGGDAAPRPYRNLGVCGAAPHGGERGRLAAPKRHCVRITVCHIRRE